MDPTTKAVLVEVARAVLRVLAPESTAKIRPDGGGTPAPAPVQQPPRATTFGGLPKPSLTPALLEGAGTAVRGDNVRIWTGNRYEVGQVIAIPRGTPRKVKVRIARAGARGKLVTIEADKAVKV